MSKKKPLPMVIMESVFVRDHQRRLRLVIALLEQEVRRQNIPPTISHTQFQPETLRAFTATQNSLGGKP